MEHNSHNIGGGFSREKQRGFSLLETMFATFILLIGVTGLMTLFVVAAVRNTNNGEQATRTTEFAQDKMEQLLTLTYNDNTTDVTGFPSKINGCTAGSCGLTLNGGSTATGLPYYSDFVDTGGTAVGITNTSVYPAAYTRYWAIDSSGTPNLTRITVKVVANLTIGANGGVSSLSPTTTLVSFKSNASY